MNQRRGRGIQRVYPIINPIEAPGIAPAEGYFDDEESVSETPKRKSPFPNNVHPSKRKCGHCTTPKSAGKWRRDLEHKDQYLCNKCGMNQRRAMSRFNCLIRLEQQRMQTQQVMDDAHFATERLPLTRSGRQAKVQVCALCAEKLKSVLTDCGHRMCGECIPALIIRKSPDELISCPCCNQVEAVAVRTLGIFLDLLISE